MNKPAKLYTKLKLFAAICSLLIGAFFGILAVIDISAVIMKNNLGPMYGIIPANLGAGLTLAGVGFALIAIAFALIDNLPKSHK